MDSVVSVRSNNKNPTTTSILTKSKNNRNNSPFSHNHINDDDSQQSSTLHRRTTARQNNERRFQFSLNNSSLQSKSHEAGLNETYSDSERPVEFSPEIMEAADKVTYITNHIKSENYYEEVSLSKIFTDPILVFIYLFFQSHYLFVYLFEFRCARIGSMWHLYSTDCS